MKKAKKILNDPRHAVAEMIEGLELANDGRVFKQPDVDALIRQGIPDGKVALLIGGGSGHEGENGEQLHDFLSGSNGKFCGCFGTRPTERSATLALTDCRGRG